MYAAKTRRKAFAASDVACAPIIERLEDRRLLSAALSGVFVGRIPADLVLGSKQQITMKLTNTGDAPIAGPVAVNVYASQDGALDGGDVALGSITRNLKLKPGRSIAVKIPIIAPTSLADGSYQLLANVDASAADGSLKSGGSTIVAPAAVQVQQPVVDLSADITEVPLQPIDAGGDPQRAVVRVRNLGNLPFKGKAAVSWFLSTDENLDASDTLIAAPPPVMLNLGAGKARLFATDVFLPSNMPVGTYDVLAKVSVGSGLVDANPANNVAVGAAPVMVVNVVQKRDERGRIIESRRQEIVAIAVGSAVIDTGFTFYVDTGDQSSTVDMSDGGGMYVPPDNSPPPDNTPIDSAPPASDPAPSDPGSGLGFDPGSGDFSSTGADF